MSHRVLRGQSPNFCSRALLSKARLASAAIAVAATVGLGSLPEARAADETTAGQLPLTKVVLFNSGVGFFEHRAEVEGNMRVDLKFNVEDVNDLLQSMVLQDLGGGQISTITYGSKEPLARTLQTFGIDLTEDPTLGDLLHQMRGEEVRVERPDPTVGVIVGVETRMSSQGEKDEATSEEVLNLLTEDGLTSVPLSQVRRIKLLNDKLDGELRQALAVLALGHATDKKTVSLNLSGDGRRPVRVGYIQETPIWKTSYRLVLSDDDPPFLQGWALVENPTEEDWNDVSLTLMSGRPISFVMDLYQSLYIERPIVQPELFGSLASQTHDQDLASRFGEFRAHARGARVISVLPRTGMGGGGGGMGGGAMGGFGGGPKPDADEPMNLQQGVETAATAADVGELFQYAISAPVNLPRQQSAMLPIVNQAVQAEKLSLFNSGAHAKHPLNALRLTNSTELHLMQGPITVFDGGVYAGNARIQDLPPGSERLVSYALDLDVEVVSTSRDAPEEMTSVSIAKGVIQVKQILRRSRSCTVKNSGSAAKRLLIEHPLDASWTLVGPKPPSEQTRSLYRFAVDAQPGEPTTLEIEEEQVKHQELVIGDLAESVLVSYRNQRVTSLAVQESLDKLVAQRQELAATTARRESLEKQLKAIETEQNRIRQNMESLDRDSELYTRYVKKFGDQEDEIEKLHADIRELADAEAASRLELEKMIADMDVQ